MPSVIDQMIATQESEALAASEREQREQAEATARQEAADAAYAKLVLAVADDRKVTPDVIRETTKAAGKTIADLKAAVDTEQRKRRDIEELGPERVAALPNQEPATVLEAVEGLARRRYLWALIQSEPTVRQRQIDLDQQLADARAAAKKAIEFAQQTEQAHASGSREIAAELEQIRSATDTFGFLSLAHIAKPAAERYRELHNTLRDLAQQHQTCRAELANLEAHLSINIVSGKGHLAQQGIDKKKQELADLEAHIGRMKAESQSIQKTFIEALK